MLEYCLCQARKRGLGAEEEQLGQSDHHRGPGLVVGRIRRENKNLSCQPHATTARRARGARGGTRRTSRGLKRSDRIRFPVKHCSRWSLK
uniref:Uncharacterized protein n=1 Tax=Steinernema glaseri TaxID=37863 RepID=A0A1I7Y8H5_9BILA